MQATSLTGRLRRSASVRDWAWWQLPLLMRCYVAAVPLAAVAVICVAAANTGWHWLDVMKFLLLVACGMISVGSTPKILYTVGGLTADFSQIWVLPIAIVLPPVYAALAPIAFLATLQVWVHRGVVYRRVFSAASISLSYALASLAFRLFPAAFAGSVVGSGVHAFTWGLAATACEVIGGRGQVLLIAGAVKLSDPRTRVWGMNWSPSALEALFVEIDLAVLITLAVALSPALVLLALPTVLLVRRFLVHPVLVAQSRVDSKTGLLNVSTWEREADMELSRAVRTRSAVAVAIADIDHFKRVNDTYGHLVGDRVLKSVSDALRGQLRDYDRAGRFGGEEFVLLLAQSDEGDACRIADRLRAHIGDLAVPIDDRPEAPCVQVTVSIGVSAMENGDARELTDLLTAADSALYRAKQTGRNRVCAAAPVHSGQLVAEIAGQMNLVQDDAAAASLCPARSLYASVTERYGIAIADARAVTRCTGSLGATAANGGLSAPGSRRRAAQGPPLQPSGRVDAVGLADRRLELALGDQVALHEDGVNDAAMLVADGPQAAGLGEPEGAVQFDRGGAAAVGDDRDELLEAGARALLDEGAEQVAAKTTAGPFWMKVDGVLGGAVVRRLGAPGGGVGVPGHLAIEVGHQERQAAGGKVGELVLPVVLGERGRRERDDTGRDVVREDRGHGGEIGGGSRADDGHEHPR